MNEIYQKLLAYYREFLTSLPRIGLAILIIIVGFFLAGKITKLLKRKIGAHAHDSLMSNFLAKTANVILIIVVILLALQAAGLSGIAGALFTTAGASVIVIGFAFKDIAENFLAGVIMAFNRPFNVDDTVQIEDIFGKVKTMEFRYTKIVTFDGRNVYIPNADILTKPVKNYTEDGFYRTDFIVGIAYENDIEKAKGIITELLQNNKELVHDDKHVNFVVEDELAASTVNLKVYLWVTTDDFRRRTLQVKGMVMQQVKTKLENAGFNLPADIRELKFYDASKSFQIAATNQPVNESK